MICRQIIGKRFALPAPSELPALSYSALQPHSG